MPLPPREPITRRTLRSKVQVRSVALFNNATTTVTLGPNPGGFGIAFQRVDVQPNVLMPALTNFLVPGDRRTVLSIGGRNVETVEHILSAFAGLGITDALVLVDGPEIPICDGSARPFVDAILEAGIEEKFHKKGLGRAKKLAAPILMPDDKLGPGGGIEAHPLSPSDAPGLHLTYRLAYPPGAPIAPQEASMHLPLNAPSPEYVNEIAPARTFCLAVEAQMMRAAGMFTHLSPREMLVIGEQGPIDNALRFANEPARHKLLDLLGDLSLCGDLAYGISARIIATRTGHAHNHAMARALGDLA